MPKFLLKLAAFASKKNENFSIFFVIGIILIIIMFLSIVPILCLNMIGSFGKNDEIINQDYEIKEKKLYKNIDKVYSEFSADLQDKMNKREADIISENTTIEIIEKINEKGKKVYEKKEVCNITVSKQFSQVNYSYILAYINHSSNVKKLEEYKFDYNEIYDFLSSIVKLKETRNDSNFIIYTEILSPEMVAQKYYNNDDEKQMYIVSYELYLSFLDFVNDNSEQDISEGESSPGDHFTYIPDNDDGDIANITDDIAKTVVEFAFSKLGYGYSQSKRDSGNYFDCSSLCYFAYKNAGITVTYGGANSAAALAQYCVQNNQTVDVNNLEPGDLIFYCCKPGNGRFKGIDHVAIYVGNGKIIDASFSKGYVVYRNIFWMDKIVMCGRPR